MANDLVQALLEAAPDAHPFSSERFGHLVTELEQSGWKARLASGGALPGPAAEAEAYFKGWLDSLAESGSTASPGAAARRRVATFAASHANAGSFLAAWNARMVTACASLPPGGGLVTAWESLDQHARLAVRASQVARLGKAAAEIAKDTVRRFRAELHAAGADGDFGEWAILEKKLAELLSKWSAAAAGAPAVAQEAMFLGRFVELVAPLHAGDDRFWMALLDGAFGPAVDAVLPEASHHVLSDPLAVLAASNGRFECVTGLRSELGLLGDREASAALDLLLAFQLAVDAPEVSLRERWRAAFARGAVAALLPAAMAALDPHRASLLDWVRPRYDRSFVDWLEDGFAFLRGLADAAVAIGAALDVARPGCQKLGDDLAVGLKGQNLPSRIGGLGLEVLGRAAWAASLSSNPKASNAHFRRALVADLGCDFADDPWRKHAQLRVGLEALAVGALAPAKPLLGLLDTVAPLTRVPVAAVTVPAAALDRIDPAGAGLPPEAPVLVANRLAMDHRLGAERSFHLLSAAWLAEQLLPAAGGKAGGLVRDCVAESLQALAHAEEGEKLPEALLKGRDALALEVGRIAASLSLPVQAAAVAHETAVGSCRGHPEWTGDDAEAAEARVAARAEATLRRVARLCSPSSGMENAAFVGWWSKRYGDAAAGEPAAWHEATLQSLHKALGRHLSPGEADVVFAVVHDLSKDVLGVGITAAAIGVEPLAAEGPSLRQLVAQAARPEAGAVPTAEEWQAAAAAAGEDHELVARAGATLSRQFAGTGDLQAAWQRVIPQLEPTIGEAGAARVADAWRAAVAALLGKVATPRRALVAGLAGPGAAIVGQVGLGRRLREHAEGFGAFAAGAAQRLMPADFQVAEGRDAERDLAERFAAWATALGGSLATEAPDVALVNTLRRPVELGLAGGGWTGRAWQFALGMLARYVSPRLDREERRALGAWMGIWEPTHGALGSLRGLADTLFASGEYTFSARPEEERAIRQVASSLAVACLVEAVRPGEGRRLAARVVLGSEVTRFRDPRKLETLWKLVASTLEGHEPRGFGALLEHVRDGFRRVEVLAPRAAGLPAAALVAAVGADGRGAWRRLCLAVPAAQQERWEAALADAGVAGPDTALPAGARELAGTTPGTLAVSVFLGECAAHGWAARPLASHAALGREAATRLADLGLLGDDSAAATAEAIAAGVPPSLALAARGFADGVAGRSLGSAVAALAEGVDAKTATECSVFAEETPFGGFEPARDDLAWMLHASALRLASAASCPPSFPLPGFGRSADLAGDRAAKLAAWLHAAVKAKADGIGARLWATEWSSALAGPAPAGEGRVLPAGIEPVAPAVIAAIAADPAPWAAKLVVAENEVLLRAAVERQLGVLARGLAASGDPEVAGLLLKPLIDEDLAGVQAEALVATWRGAGPALAASVPAAALPLWVELADSVADAVAEVVAGRELQAKANEIAKGTRGRLGTKALAPLGALPELLPACLDELGAALRVLPPSLASLRVGRFAAAVLARLGDAPRSAWGAVARALAETAATALPPAGRGAGRRALETMVEQWTSLAGVRAPVAVLATGQGPWNADGIDDSVLLSVVAAGLVGDASVAPAKALVQRIVAHEAGWSSAPARTWGKRTAAWLERWKELAGAQVPAGPARRLAEIPRQVELLERSREVSGNPWSLPLALLSGERHAKATWMAALLSRVTPEHGVGTPSGAELAAQSLAGWTPPEDGDALSRAKAIETIVGMRGSLAPAAEAAGEAKGGFLSSIFGRKKADAAPAAEGAKYRDEAFVLALRASCAAACGVSGPSVAWRLEGGTPRPRGGLAEAEARHAYLRGIVAALARDLGAQHAVTVEFRAVADQTPAFTFALVVASEGDGLAERLLKALPGSGASELAALLRVLAAHGAGWCPASAGASLGEAYKVGDRPVVAAAGAQAEALKGAAKGLLADAEWAAADASLQALRQVAVG